MSKAIKVCKVCGKEYEYCRTYLPTAFRWQDVACCREHAQRYFQMVKESRSADSNATQKSNDAVPEAELTQEPVSPTKTRTRNRKKTQVTNDEGDRA